MRMWKTLTLAALLAVGATQVAAPARAASEQQQLVDRAAITINEARNDASFGNAPDLLRRAKAVMVVPELIKAGFFFGGEGGNGVLLARRDDGSWSDPAFYGMGSASFGLQIGVEAAEVVFFVMSDRALRAWMADEVKLGAKAGLTVLMLGSNAEASATTNANVDVIAWARAKGAYAGITLEGSLIKPRNEWNDTYYGRKVNPPEIIAGTVTNPGTTPLRTVLSMN